LIHSFPVFVQTDRHTRMDRCQKTIHASSSTADKQVNITSFG